MSGGAGHRDPRHRRAAGRRDRPRRRGPCLGGRRDPPVDRRLARLHLRVGQLSLARAELEALAGSGDLDDEGLRSRADALVKSGYGAYLLEVLARGR